MTTTLARPRTASSRDLRHMSLEELVDLANRLNGSAVPLVRMSEREFLDWCPEEMRAEWVDGKVVLMAPENYEHDNLHSWLITLVRLYIEENDLGVMCQNMFVRLSAQRRMRVPDVMFITTKRLSIIHRTYLEGPPDFVIEIISPDSQSRDRREKYEEYQRAGVREYWIIDPLSKTVEASRLKGKKFEPMVEKQGWIGSTVIRGFGLKPQWLWQKPLPKVSASLRQIKSK